MNTRTLRFALAALLAAALHAGASSFVDEAATAARRDLDAAVQELASQRDTIAAEKIPLVHELDRRTKEGQLERMRLRNGSD